MAAEDQEIGVERLDIDRHMGHALCGVDQDACADCTGCRRPAVAPG
jgi:hypothetical protein